MALKKICLVTTSPLIVNFFLVPYLRRLREIGEVHLALDTSGNVPLKETSGAITYSIPIRRQIAPWHDLLTLIQLTRHFARNRFDIVHSFGPKAGLLTALAGWLARIPLRLHTFTGQVWITRKGVMRWILRAADKIIATLNTHILADSPSQRDILVEEDIVRAEKCKVLASGSVSGVDTSRFRPDPVARGELRAALGIPLNAMTFLYLGRLTRDKGILDLARAFDSARLESGYLVFVGPDEDGLQHGIEHLCGPGRAKLRFAGYTPAPERYLAAADVLCLPSYREGFGSTIIEAAAAGIPAVGSRIYGITDAIIDGRTGLLHAPGAIEEIAACLRRLANDDALRSALGNAARQRALSEFTQDRVMSAVLAFYRGLLDV